MKKKIFKVVVILISILSVFIFITFTDGWRDLIKKSEKINFYFLIAACACICFYWLLESIILHITIKKLYKTQRFYESLKVTMIGQFFNSVTPFATGGQPAQLYIMVKDGIPANVSASILIVKFIIYQSILVLYSLFLIIFKSDFFISYLEHYFIFVIIGFIVNLGVITMLFIISRHNKLTVFLIDIYLFILQKFKLKKDIKEYELILKQKLVSYHDNVILLKSNFKLILSTSLLTILQLTFFNIIPYFIYLSISSNVSKVDVGDIIAANSFVMMITSFIPLPGGSGGAEGGFFVLFTPFFKDSTLLGLLLWRSITFFSCLVVGGAVTLLVEKKEIKDQILK